MSISNEALQKLVNEIQAQAIHAEKQIGVVKSQISAKQREIRLLQLTSTEVSTLPSNTHVFVFSPTADIDKRLNRETKELKVDIDNLGKKLQYLETTYEKSTENIARILQSGGRA
ncbi:hypothetical protein DSL72_004965 [Monilinia vaccinii-corymbosi]|uniref:Prefoldin subunit 1 n=1 Tax=Monilinia vaccinii-corymbosi TaxID=61207 RepID=A0A8A3P0J0_9HELO|nr:hypothetical protein DSL72_004965 [Monilinia vaccinii-corymbosi]